MESSQENPHLLNDECGGFGLNMASEAVDDRWDRVNAALDDSPVKKAPLFVTKPKEDNFKIPIPLDPTKNLKERRKTLVMDKEKNELKRMKIFPPGIQIFGTSFLSLFSAETLDLESHFGYKGKKRIESELNKSFELYKCNFLEFVTLVSPETSSLAIKTSEDFGNICNYIFYSSVSCSSPENREILGRCLIDLLTNYDWGWKISYANLLGVLQNLGMDKRVLNSIEQPKLPFDVESSSKPIDSGLINFVMSLLESLNRIRPAFVEFGNSRKISFSVADFVRILIQLSSDVRFLEDSCVKFSILGLIDCLLSLIPSFEWWSKGSNSGLLDVAEILLRTSKLPFIQAKTWDLASMPPKWKEDQDHHHNVVYKLSLLPNSRRGKILIKVTSFLFLQYILKPNGGLVSTPIVNSKVILRALKTNEIAFKNLFNEHYAMLSIIRLIDLAVGSDPLTDFSREGSSYIKSLLDVLNNYSKKLKHDLLDDTPSYLTEVITITNFKWTHLSSGTSVTPKITEFFKTY